jgi:uncharacterized membrane protein
VQWRGGSQLQAGRLEAIESIYAAQSAPAVHDLLNEYGIQYVVIGNLERATYDNDGLDRLAAILTPVFASGTTTVFAR